MIANFHEKTVEELTVYAFFRCAFYLIIHTRVVAIKQVGTFQLLIEKRRAQS